MSQHIALFLFCLFYSVLPAYTQNLSPAVKLVASSRSAADAFGASVAKDGAFAVVGTIYDDDLGEDAGATYIYKKQPNGTWQEIQKLTASDGVAGHFFGAFVAISGNYILIGSPNADAVVDGTVVPAAGAAYVFEKDQNDVWTEVVKLTAFDAHTDDYFARVAVYGKFAVVGAGHNEYDAAGNNYLYASGAAYVFERTDGGIWFPVQKLTASDRTHGGFFACPAIYNHTIVIGAYGTETDADNLNILPDAGAAYVFERNISGTWDEVQKLIPLQRHANAAFGQSVAISANHILVGAHMESYDLNGNNALNNAGAAYFFERNAANEWEETQKLVASDRQTQDAFGYKVGLDGPYALVGSLFHNLNASGGASVEDAGAAYLYRNTGTSTWEFTQKVVAPSRFAYDNFGIDVAVDGSTILIGASREDEDAAEQNTISNAGSVYVFEILNPLDIEQNTSGTISVYPNPTEGLLQIDPVGLSGNAVLKLTDLSGKLLNEQHLPLSGKIDYAMEQPVGVYFLEITCEQQTIYQKILVR